MLRTDSDRDFGLLFTVVFSGVGLWPLWRGGPAGVIPLVIAVAFLAFALLWPSALHPLNRAWTALGLLLGRIVNPIVTALLFILLITPAALISRWLGRDPLRRKRPATDSYWIPRDPPGPPAATMSKQY